jgi:predicted MarR family transcription regulator
MTQSAGKRSRAAARRLPVGPVVSAAHLASGRLPALSELEFALNVATNAYQRWMVRGMAAAGVAGLAPVDVQILHHVNHRDREKTLADLCLVLNIEDTHLVNYAIKKLAGLGLVRTGRRGKEKTIAITEKGFAACERYHEVREALLIRGVAALGFEAEAISGLAALMRALSGQYDQAARGAASL